MNSSTLVQAFYTIYPYEFIKARIINNINLVLRNTNLYDQGMLGYSTYKELIILSIRFLLLHKVFLAALIHDHNCSTLIA
jgi:hypothetical protein